MMVSRGGGKVLLNILMRLIRPIRWTSATQAPHVAIRHYVMGDRCYEDATREDMEKMRDVTSRGA